MQIGVSLTRVEDREAPGRRSSTSVLGRLELTARYATTMDDVLKVALPDIVA